MVAVDSHDCDIVVLGATPGGIASAVRAAREGLETHLVTFNAHLGGMMAGGLSVTDTTLSPTRSRAPLLDEFFDRIRAHYRETYGPDSPEYDDCNEGLFFEPKVAEKTFEEMIGEAGVTVHREYHPVDATRNGQLLRRVTFESFDEDDAIEVTAKTFVDATYEGDLAAVAGVECRLGRESREEFGEQYAGRLFSEKQTQIFPGSTGVGDDAVQAYDYRLCLSKDPNNRKLPDKPSDYNREEFLPMVEDDVEETFGHGKAYQSEEIPCYIKSELVRPTVEEIREMGLESYLLLRGPLPNDKRDLNTADLPGEADDYPEADWGRRREIADRHKSHALGMLYFLQNDDAVPDDLQEEACQWGLPEDEFEDNDGFPFQLYVREGRRIVGRKTFTEHDARLTEGIDRSPIHADSIAIAEYAMDSHDCRPVRRPGSLAEGHHFLGEITVPSQVPYGALLPEELDNLLVPVPMSATHVGFGTIRLEPTWMQIGESAGYAAAVASASQTTPGDLDPTELQQRLIEDGTMVSFFDDVYLNDDGAGTRASQYLATKGYFDSYDARLNDPLTVANADQWARLTAAEYTGDGNPTDRARSLSPEDGEPVTRETFVSLLTDAFERAELSESLITETVDQTGHTTDGPLLRGEACELVSAVLT